MTRRLALAAAVMVALGVLVGVVWATVWTTPDGIALNGSYHPVGDAARSSMDVTGHYVLLSLGAGFLGAFATLLLTGRRAMAAWAVAVLSAVLAGLVAAQLGLWLGPADPSVVARTTPDWEPVASDLSLPGSTPYLAFPAGAALGLAVGLVAGVARERGDGGHRAGR